MIPFGSILARAEERVGGAAALEAILPWPKPTKAMRDVPDDRYLSLMCLRIFRAGLKHSLVDGKWPAFEAVFHGFDARRIRAMSEEDIEKLMNEKRIIRHYGKLRAVPANAAAMIDVSEAHGGFGAYLADWPGEDVTGLWADLAERFSQLGGNSGAYFLRMAGKDTFILTPYVIAELISAGVIERKPGGKKDRARVQAAFNAWAAETGRPLCQLSMILARAQD